MKIKVGFKSILCSSLLLAFSLPALQAATKLSINSVKDLEVRDSNDLLVTSLSNGTIAKTIKSDNQAFKISYGKDLKSRLTTIIYPDPEKPQNLSINLFGKDVEISSDAVLTTVADSDLSSISMQSGILGKITVAGSELSNGNSMQFKNGAVVAPSSMPTPSSSQSVASNEPSLFTPSATSSESSNQASKPSPPTRNSSVPANYDGGKARLIEGDVMIAPKGKSVVELVRESSTPPRLIVGQTVAPGSSIQTGPTGKAYISPFPGAVLMIPANSVVEFEEMSWKNKDGKVERKMQANIKQGSAISIIKGINRDELDYKIKTPHGVAAARGTVYKVKNSGSSSTATVSQGTVVVNTSEGKVFEINVDSGNQLTYPDPSGGEPVQRPADSADIIESEGAVATSEPFFQDNPEIFDPTGNPELPPLPPIGPGPGPRLTPDPMTPVGP